MENEKLFRVCTKTDDRKDIPLSQPIADKGRAEFAYHMFDHMRTHGSVFSVNGEPLQNISRGLPSDLYIAEQSELDETGYHADSIYTPMQHGDHWNTEQKDNLYTVTALDSKHMKFVNFAPMTEDYEEANEMFNFMQFGLDPSLSITYLDNGVESEFVKDGHPGNLSMTDENNRIVTERTERDWASTRSFADAVESISLPDMGMERN